MCLLFLVKISKELFGQHNKILLCLKGGGQADGFRRMWCLTTPPSNISVYLPKHLPICKQPGGPCPKSSHKVVILAKTGQCASLSLGKRRGGFVLNTAGGQDPLCLPLGLRAAGRLWAELGRGSLSWLRVTWRLWQALLPWAGHTSHCWQRGCGLRTNRPLSNRAAPQCASLLHKGTHPFFAKSLPQKYLHMVLSSWFQKDLANCDTWHWARVSNRGCPGANPLSWKKGLPPGRGTAESKARLGLGSGPWLEFCVILVWFSPYCYFWRDFFVCLINKTRYTTNEQKSYI